MPRILYPFAAVPNQIIRGGHGAINIAVLAALLSHGKVTASGATLAREIGCSRASVFGALKYWKSHGKENGIVLRFIPRHGETSVYEVEITHMENRTRPTNGHPCPTNGRPTRLTRGHKEEPYKKNQEEEGAGDMWISPHRGGKGAESLKEILSRRAAYPVSKKALGL